MLKTLIAQLQAIPGGKERQLHAGAYLFRQGDAVESLFLVLEGEIHLQRYQPDGSSITLQQTKTGGLLAEASLYSDQYHCHAFALKPSRIHALPKTLISQHMQRDTELARNWMAYLAQEVQQARVRSEIVSLKTVAARLDAWLNWQGGQLPPRGEWKSMAQQLGVSPEALYREIARRK